MKESTRQQKVARLVQKELGNLFLFDAKSLFGSVFISVTQVRISPDLGLAKVYLSVMNTDQAAQVVSDVQARKSEIRKMLGQKVGKQLRIVPDLAFYHDDSAEYASNIDQILKGLDIPPESTDQA